MGSARFNMDDYVDVAERIAMFNDKFPEGSLQSKLEPSRNAAGDIVGWLCKAWAYRTAEDVRPGVGHAWEPVPGLTPYTKNSEAMNAETSAWGRAIIALGFPTKKIASANEVRNRQPAARVEGPEELAAPKSWAKLTEMVSVYDQQVHDWFMGFGAALSKLTYGEAELSKADKDWLFQKSAGAAVHLREQFDPGALPYPTVDDVRACFAMVLDGQELALEGEDA